MSTGTTATGTTATAGVLTWDEPAGCTSPRGWLHSETIGACVGFYLDYGPGHYRSAHETDVGGGRIVSFCQPSQLCRDCQPGNILAVRYPDGPSTATESRYVGTVADARQWVESATITREHFWQVVSAGVALAGFNDADQAASYAAGVSIPGQSVDVVQAY